MSLDLFAKTNGRDIPQAQGYVLEFYGIIKFEQDCMYGGPIAESPFTAKPGIPQGSLQQVAAIGWSTAHKGQVTHMKGEMDYEKTEKGWRLSRCNAQFF